MSSLVTQPTKWPNEFSNQTCVFIRPSYLMLSLNTNFEATLTQDMHCISIFRNQGVHHEKHGHQSIQEMVQILVGLQMKIFKPREFYCINIFAVQSMSWQSCYVMCKVFCILLTLSLPVYQNAHANSVCDKRFSIRSLFYFQCSTVNIHKYKGECVLRIPHASDGLKLWSFHYFE